MRPLARPEPGVFARVAAAAVFVAGCAEVRDPEASPPTYATSIQSLLAGDGTPANPGRCGECHGATDPEAGWSVSTFIDTIACVDRTDPEGLPVPAVLPASDEAPILAVLDDPTHAGLLDEAETAALREWVTSGAPASRGRAHPIGYADPRSPEFHGPELRAERWERMFEDVVGACGGCHAGSPNSGGTVIAGAPDCASCHSEPEGVLDCGTCHGVSGERAKPPGDLCFFPEQARTTAGAHPGHPPGVACSSCHPTRGTGGLRTGPHGDGVVDVEFDPDVAGPDASYDPETLQCFNACHNGLGGNDPGVFWSPEQQLNCNDCHQSPPEDHFPGPCTDCHVEVNAAGTVYEPGTLHGNGVADYGNGNRGCGSCHGDGENDPWPGSNAHPAHREPDVALQSDCGDCHPIPPGVIGGDHLNGVADVVLDGLAAARGQTPSYEPGTQTCNGVACHGAGLAGGFLKAPAWDDASGDPATCGACHAVPPPPPHSRRDSCGLSYCHAGILDGFGNISEEGREIHVNGEITVGARE